ncbi:unnamed protein product [Parnassius mnemosyne]|uniref:FP protein C-terminal domain-containing protein n=1 Tax=Parnassius mnemosyne TaxID=213953 RepID=A0AAV1KBR5_9NEOP
MNICESCSKEFNDGAQCYVCKKRYDFGCAAAARACKTLEAKDVGFGGNRQRVFVNDHLTPEHKKLLTKTRTLAKDRGYSYIWVKYGKIHIRKNDTSPVLIIAKEADLNKIA